MKKGRQQEKKRKRRNEDLKEEIEEEVDVEDGEKVFTSSRTGKRHYYEVAGNGLHKRNVTNNSWQ